MVNRSQVSPILKMLVITIIVAMCIILINEWFISLPNYENLITGSGWMLADLVHIPQFLISFSLICYISKGNLGEYGFNLHEDSHFTHKRMFVVGVLFGFLFSLKYIPQVIGDIPLDIPRPVTPANILGNMTFQWIVVGISEETMFRGLIQTYLMKELEGEINIAGHEFQIGTVIAAIFWGGFHFINTLVAMPIHTVLFLVLLTTAVGLVMGYAYQMTGSILTTIIVHNTIFGVPLVIGYLLYWFV